MENKNRWKCNCWSSDSYQLQGSKVLSGAVRPSPPASSRELEDNNPAAATEAAAGQISLFGEAWPFPKKTAYLVPEDSAVCRGVANT